MTRVDLRWKSFGSWPGPLGSDLSTLPLTKVTLLTRPPCHPSSSSSLPPAAVFPWSVKHGFSYWELCIYSISSDWFQPSVPSHLDLNFAWCPEPMSLSTDVILAFPWCSSTSALTEVNDVPSSISLNLPSPLPTHTYKFLPWLKHHYWVTLNFWFTVIPQITFVVIVLTSVIWRESLPCILISPVYMYSPLSALPLVRREVADRSCIWHWFCRAERKHGVFLSPAGAARSAGRWRVPSLWKFSNSCPLTWECCRRGCCGG